MGVVNPHVNWGFIVDNESFTNPGKSALRWLNRFKIASERRALNNLLHEKWHRVCETGENGQRFG